MTVRDCLRGVRTRWKPMVGVVVPRVIGGVSTVRPEPDPVGGSRGA